MIKKYHKNCDKYYGNYDLNIKSIKGGGVITPSNPPNKRYQTETINNTWNDDINPTPPLFETVYYSNKNLSNGYLNTNNWVTKKKPIADYYYPSQKLNKVCDATGKSSRFKKKINEDNPIKFPPPLIDSKFVNKNIDKNENAKNKVDKMKSNSDDEFLNFVKKNGTYDGKYIYIVENKPMIFDPYETHNILKFPYFEPNVNDLENFNNLKKVNGDSSWELNNFYLLMIISLLLIVYLSFWSK